MALEFKNGREVLSTRNVNVAPHVRTLTVEEEQEFIAAMSPENLMQLELTPQEVVKGLRTGVDQRLDLLKVVREV